MASVCAVYGKISAKKFDHGNIIGFIDFSILDFCNSHLFRACQFLILTIELKFHYKAQYQ